MSSDSSVIHEFMQAWNALDIDRIMGFFTDDALYTNIPMGPPHEGKAAIREFIEGFMATTTEIDFVVHNQVDDGNGVVMNERTDNLVMGGATVSLPVMGVFELADGKIKGWRDYFDMGAFAS